LVDKLTAFAVVISSVAPLAGVVTEKVNGHPACVMLNVVGVGKFESVDVTETVADRVSPSQRSLLASVKVYG
jgi:hypothetical protein